MFLKLRRKDCLQQRLATKTQRCVIQRHFLQRHGLRSLLSKEPFSTTCLPKVLGFPILFSHRSFQNPIAISPGVVFLKDSDPWKEREVPPRSTQTILESVTSFGSYPIEWRSYLALGVTILGEDVEPKGL